MSGVTKTGLLVWLIGRIGGPTMGYDWRTLEHFRRIAKKHNLDIQKFLTSIIRAWSRGTARCEKLSVECLIKTDDYPRFRVTENEHLITQTKVNLKLLKDVAKGKPVDSAALSKRIQYILR